MIAHPVRAMAIILALSAAGGTAWAGDPVEGGRIAERWCSSCHVASNRSGGTDAVPTLESISNDPRRSPEWVRQWLNDPHPPMPDLSLTRAEIRDLLAYIASLRR